MQFASHHQIVDDLKTKILCTPMAPLLSVVHAKYQHVNAIRELYNLHKQMVDEGLTDTHDPFLRIFNNNPNLNFHWGLDPRNCAIGPDVIDTFQFLRGHRAYYLWVFSDRSALVCFHDPKQKHLRAVPWPLQIQDHYKGRKHKVSVFCKCPDPELPEQRLCLAWDQPDTEWGVASTLALKKDDSHPNSETMRKAFLRVLKNEAVKIVDAFEAAAPLIIDLEDPAWLTMSDHVVPFFAKIPGERHGEGSKASTFVDHLADYVAIKYPESFKLFVTCNILSPTIKEDGSVTPLEVKIEYSEASAEIERIAEWAHHYTMHADDPLQIKGCIKQTKGHPEVLAHGKNTRVLSAHHRLEVIGRVRGLMRKYPLPEKTGSALAA